MASTIGRVGSSIMPFLIIELYSSNKAAPFLLFALMSCVAGIAAFLIPYDTRGRYLDRNVEEIIESEIYQPFLEDSKTKNPSFENHYIELKK